jgi:hypothetical protein
MANVTRAAPGQRLKDALRDPFRPFAEAEHPISNAVACLRREDGAAALCHCSLLQRADCTTAAVKLRRERRGRTMPAATSAGRAIDVLMAQKAEH